MIPLCGMRGKQCVRAIRGLGVTLRTAVVALFLANALSGAEPWEDARRKLLRGEYEDVVRIAGRASLAKDAGEDWPLIHAEALQALGRHAEAESALHQALLKETQSIRLRWKARQVALALGHAAQAEALLHEMAERITRRRGAYRLAPDLVVFGRMALDLGADPKDVLERVYAEAQKSDPKARDVYLARGDLALDKHDFPLAAKAFSEGLEKDPTDPDLLYGAARAYEEGDRKAMLTSLEAALAANPRHVPSLLLLVDHEVDAENYGEAEQLLERCDQIHPAHPDVAAYRAVIALLANRPAEAQVDRAKGLVNWAENPRVDHLIGRKLSQKYRFAEGAAAQRRALAFDQSYLPAKAQLANDLLRLGDENEGWTLAQAVHERDGYDVEAYNLITLRDTLAKYASLENEHFIVRMTSRESAVYGAQVMGLLARAREALVTRYGVQLSEPTRVDIFGDQKDFAVRTFGMPDVQGFLGVCFGRVITANSPVALGGKGANWESVLWHEFCHVVTLQFTKNRMPRWLSEGISVYEEGRADPAWGMQMTPRYRQMIRDGKLTPIVRLSSVFLTAPSQEAVQFAYFQSSLVVEFIVERYGIDALKAVLESLRDGADSLDALARHAAPLGELDKEFAVFAQRKANAFASDAAMEDPPAPLLKPGGEAGLADWVKRNPGNFWGALSLARQLAREEKWAELVPLLVEHVRRFPAHAEADSAYAYLAAAYRHLDKPTEKKQILTT